MNKYRINTWIMYSRYLKKKYCLAIKTHLVRFRLIYWHQRADIKLVKMGYSLNTILTRRYPLELYFSIQYAILLIEKAMPLMFRALEKFLRLIRCFRAPKHFDFYVEIDNPKLSGLALQLGTLPISSNGWRRSLGALNMRGCVLHLAELGRLSIFLMPSVFPIYLCGTTIVISFFKCTNKCERLTKTLFLSWYFPLKLGLFGSTLLAYASAN